MSLRLRLLLIIGMSLSLLWAAVAGWMFMDARQSLRDALDNRLAASARMVAGLVAQFPQPGDIVANSSKPLDVVARDGVACEVSLVRGEVVIEAVARTTGSPDLARAPVGFGTHRYGDKRWRTYVLRQGNIQIATADSIDVREALVKELILSAGLPFVVALLGSLVLVWFGITHGLAPLERIRDLLARRRPGDDSPLPKVKAPVELHPLLHTIEQLLERLQAAIVRERRFTDSAAHELRTPLTGVKTHIQVAKLASRRPGEGPTLGAALAKADQGVLQLQSILQRLLELARLEGQPAGTEASDPLEAVYAAIQAVQPLYGDAASRVTVQGAADACQVRVARPLLLAALTNLIDNAIRYTPAGTPIAIHIETQSNGTLRLSVLDEGPGLDDEGRAQAANRFWRGDIKTPGNGLGLSIVDAIARRHGGTLELLARDGPGLEARLVLPIALKTAPS
ncbi:ATP-binding protein [Pusillimonas sp. SM2304]|uniref:sensor histidine kinase n=1 Tax=Pusillimonas sp. SM2304 TaxID=3073241 RepID=UPI0028752449|nr:ATP-binding protein [Pusillimonas sp. SM2304]MDS1142267.1 ATP-binding protein [Pusillimonas sp. SM2304]